MGAPMVCQYPLTRARIKTTHGDMTNELDQIIERCRKLADGRSLRGLALEAGLSKNSLYGMREPDWTPHIETLKALVKLLPKT